MKMILRFLPVLIVILFALSLSCSNRFLHNWDAALADRMSKLPDSAVVYMDNFRAAGFVGQGKLKPIPPELVSPEDFPPALLAPFKYSDGTYVMPHNTQTLALAINTDLFKQAGLDQNLPPLSWEELQIYAEKLRAVEGNPYGLALTPAFWEFAPFLYQAGGSLTNEQGTEMALNTKEADLALDRYVKLYQADPIFAEGGLPLPKDDPNWGMYDVVLDAFAKDRIGMMPIGPSMYTKLLSMMSEEERAKVKLIDLPAGPGGIRATDADIAGFGIWNTTGAPPNDATKRFLTYLGSKDAMQFWIGKPGDRPDYVPAAIANMGAWTESHPEALPFLTGVEFIQPRQRSPVTKDGIFAFETDADMLILEALQGGKVGEVLMKLQDLGTKVLNGYKA